MTTSTLATIFGWCAVILPAAWAIYAACTGRRQTVMVALIVAIVAGTAQYYRSKDMAELTVNRWEPLSSGEQVRLKNLLERIDPPRDIFQVLCPLAGCQDLSESLMAVFPIPGWNASSLPAFWFHIPDGIELWGHDEKLVTDIANAIETATDSRLHVVTKTNFEGGAGQVNLLIGRKIK